MAKNRLKVALHAFAGVKLGSGHLKRCLVLAEVIARRDCTVNFVTNDYGKKLIGSNFPVVLVMKQEYRVVKDNLNKLSADIIVYDIPGVNNSYIARTASPGAVKVVFDYYNRMSVLKEADFVFNFHRCPGIARYIKGNFFEGMEYALLNREFYQAWERKEVVSNSCNIMLSFGSTDPLDITSRVFASLLEYRGKNIFLHVVLGRGMRAKSRIENLARQVPGIFKIYKDVRNMAQLMAQMDLMIVSGGLTLFEAAQLRIPVMVICAHKYAFELADYLAKSGVAVNMGFHNTVNKALIWAALDRLLKDDGLRLMRKNFQRSGIFINGAKKIPDIILKTSRGCLA